jgi:hypothetical protein
MERRKKKDRRAKCVRNCLIMYNQSIGSVDRAQTDPGQPKCDGLGKRRGKGEPNASFQCLLFSVKQKRNENKSETWE